MQPAAAPTSHPVLFACSRLSCRLTLDACSKRWAVSNGAAAPRSKHDEKFGTKPIDRRCVECPIGKVHHETGVLSPDVSVATLGAMPTPAVRPAPVPPPPAPALVAPPRRAPEPEEDAVPAPKKPSAEDRPRRSYMAHSEITRGDAFDLVKGGTPNHVVCSQLGIKRSTLDLWVRTWRAEGKLPPRGTMPPHARPAKPAPTPLAPVKAVEAPRPVPKPVEAPKPAPEPPMSPDDAPTVPSRKPIQLPPVGRPANVEATAEKRSPYLVSAETVVRLARQAGRNGGVDGTRYVLPLPGGRFASIVLPPDFGRNPYDAGTIEALLPELATDLALYPPNR